MISKVMMAALIGTMYCTPKSPSGISRLSAASGPYAAELSPSNPKMGMPWMGPICSARSSEVLIGLPTSKSRIFMCGSATLCAYFRPVHFEREQRESQPLRADGADEVQRQEVLQHFGYRTG